MRKNVVAERLNRLAGGNGRGGGLPLPHLFSEILNELLDEGSATTARVIEITRATLDFKAAAVLATWSSYEELAQDVLDQMEYREVIRLNGEDWVTGEAFRTGEFIEVIPKRPGSRRDGVTVWPREEREVRSRVAMAEGDAGSLIARPNPVEHDVVARLRKSAEEIGHQYPVLTFPDGRVIDGHHRLQADPAWRKEVAKRRDGVTDVTTDAEGLALIRDLDIHREPLPPKTVAAIDRILGELAGTNEIKRDRVQAELRRDASRSNHVIAEAVGVSVPFVVEERSKLATVNSIHEYQFKGGKGVRSGRHAASCWCGEGEAESAKKPAPEKAPKPARNTTRKYDDPELQEAVREKRHEGESLAPLAGQFGIASTTVDRAAIAVDERLRLEREADERRRIREEEESQERQRHEHLLAARREKMDRTVQEYRDEEAIVLKEVIRRLSDLLRAI